jgi:thiol-disulfide isomerase/thioredoxin
MKLTRYLAMAVGATTLGLGAVWGYAVFTALVPMPDVAYTRLDGSPAQTQQLKGKVVLVNFWATSCATCVKEMPKLVALDQKFHAQGYETLAVAMKGDPPAYVVNFVETRKLPFTVAIDNLGEIAKRFGDVRVTPTSLLVNKRGDIVKRYVGEPDFVALEGLVAQLLAEP